MRRQPGKRRNITDLRKRHPNAFEIEVPNDSMNPFEHAPFSEFIRENCRRGDYAAEYHVFVTGERHRVSFFLFADSTDAILFKMRFK